MRGGDRVTTIADTNGRGQPYSSSDSARPAAEVSDTWVRVLPSVPMSSQISDLMPGTPSCAMAWHTRSRSPSALRATVVAPQDAGGRRDLNPRRAGYQPDALPRLSYGYSFANPLGQRPAIAAAELLQEMCDNALHVDKYEPLLAQFVSSESL